MEHLATNWRERRRTYNASMFWFHFAICRSTGTSVVFTVVSGLDTVTVTKSFLLKKRCFLILGTLTARMTSKRLKIIGELGFIDKHDMSAQRVARGMVLRAIQRFQCCSRMALSCGYTKGGIDAPSSCTLRSRGTWAGEWVTITTVINHRPASSTHAFRSIWLYSTSRSVAILLLCKRD
jgi:hypothetical protein